MAAATKKVRTLRFFHDLKEDVDRKVGDEFECSADRMAEIIAAYDEPLVEEVKAARKAPAKAKAKATETE